MVYDQYSTIHSECILGGPYQSPQESESDSESDLFIWNQMLPAFNIMAAVPLNEKARKTQRLCCMKDTSEKTGSLISELIGNFYRQHNEALHEQVETLQADNHIQHQCIVRMSTEMERLRTQVVEHQARTMRTRADYRENYDRMIALTDALAQFLDRADTEARNEMNEALDIAGRRHGINLRDGFDDGEETESDGFDMEELIQLEEELQNPLWQEES